jgi:hypothetical protein
MPLTISGWNFATIVAFRVSGVEVREAAASGRPCVEVWSWETGAVAAHIAVSEIDFYEVGKDSE